MSSDWLEYWIRKMDWAEFWINVIDRLEIVSGWVIDRNTDYDDWSIRTLDQDEWYIENWLEHWLRMGDWLEQMFAWLAVKSGWGLNDWSEEDDWWIGCTGELSSLVKEKRMLVDRNTGLWLLSDWLDADDDWLAVQESCQAWWRRSRCWLIRTLD